MAEYHLGVAPWHMKDLLSSQKHFVVIKEPTPPLHYGDVLFLSHPVWSQPVIRWIRYLESGLGYAPGYVGIELAP